MGTNVDYQKLSKKAIGCMLVNEILLGVLCTVVYTVLWFLIPANILTMGYGIIVILTWGVCIAAPFVRYQRYRYRFSEEDIDVREGFLFIHRDIVPIERLHKVALESGPIDRIFSLSKVIVTTAGGDVTIRFIETKEAEKIVDRLKRRINQCAIKKREG